MLDLLPEGHERHEPHAILLSITCPSQVCLLSGVDIVGTGLHGVEVPHLFTKVDQLRALLWRQKALGQQRVPGELITPDSDDDEGPNWKPTKMVKGDLVSIPHARSLRDPPQLGTVAEHYLMVDGAEGRIGRVRCCAFA
jgi:hypothetical protein